MSAPDDPTRSHAHPPLPDDHAASPAAAPGAWTAQPVPSPRPRRRKRGIAFIAAGIVAVAGGIAALVLVFVPGTFTARGSLTLSDTPDLAEYGGYGLSSQAISFTGSSCSGIGGYADLGVGSGVTIRDANGTIVGVGEITDSEDVQPVCVFTFTVHDVPSGEGPYTVEISHRGKVTVTEQALADGTAALSIGN